MRAPMRRRGSVTRPMGLRAIDWSPASTARPSTPVAQPASKRMAVPELPTSTSDSGSVSRSGPPSTIRDPSESRLIPAPNWPIARRVQRTSSPLDSPDNRDRPTARAASSRARCDTDLSPGTLMRPFRPPTHGSATKVVTDRAAGTSSGTLVRAGPPGPARPRLRPRPGPAHPAAPRRCGRSRGRRC